VIRRHSKVRFGLLLDTRGAVIAGERYTPADLLRLASRAEQLGFDFVSAGDSMLAKPRYAPIPMLAAVAAITSRIELTTGILQPHLRHPVQLAQEWATLDTMSGGRTTLAVGLGSGRRDLVAAELAQVGLSYRTRAEGFEESVSLLRALWTSSGPVTYRGRFWNLDGTDPVYRQVRPGGVPILIACGTYNYNPLQSGISANDGGRPDSADTIVGKIDRVARIGDGWMTGMLRPEEWAGMWVRLQAEGEAAGRDLTVSSFERRFTTYIHVGHAPGGIREVREFMEAYQRLPIDDAALDRWLIYGSAADCARRLSELIDAGVNSFQFALASNDQGEQLERLGDALSSLTIGATRLSNPGSAERSAGQITARSDMWLASPVRFYEIDPGKVEFG
jgi:alkanesulfonate monooxygenase SsuD/methylene tetrahydromethanopterin reductase-like flavin-dependent oxidoreductase (luciferase family)